MDPGHFVLLLGGLLFLAFLAEALLERFRLPPVLLLLFCGVLLGPVFHVLPATRFQQVAPHFGALAFLLVLFEGGLDLELKTLTAQLRSGMRLALFGFCLSAFAIGLLAWGAGLPPAPSIAFGLAAAPISGSIVIPLAKRVALPPKGRTLVVLEASLADVLGVLSMALLLNLLGGGGLAALVAAGNLFAAAFSVLVAGLAGLFWPPLLARIEQRRFLEVLTFGMAMLLWGLTELPGASGALAVLAFGVALANEAPLRRLFRLRPHPFAAFSERQLARLREFIASLTFLVRTFFFVFLGVVVAVVDLDWRVAGVVVGSTAVVFGVRKLLLAWEFPGEALPDSLRRQLLFLQPRGLVSAVLAMEAAEAFPAHGAALLAGISGLILLSNAALVFAIPGGQLGGSVTGSRRRHLAPPPAPP